MSDTKLSGHILRSHISSKLVDIFPTNCKAIQAQPRCFVSMITRP